MSSVGVRKLSGVMNSAASRRVLVFINNGSKAEAFGKLLTQNGYHSSGNIMYNGMTEQIEMEIFMGPTYYIRLKHMVKDEMNYGGVFEGSRRAGNSCNFIPYDHNAERLHD